MTGKGQLHDSPDSYLRLMRQEVPEYDEMQSQIVRSVRLEAPEPRILDLGVGTGETSSRFVAEHESAQLVGIDTSEAMLSIARGRLPQSAVLLRQDLADTLPAGPFHGVVSAFAIHHLDSAGKRDLFDRVHARLWADGRFVFGDVVVPEVAAVPRTPIEPGVDRPDTAKNQVAWLQQSGFNAKVVWARRDLAVFSATRWEP